MKQSMIRIVGVYPAETEDPVYLIEAVIDLPPQAVDMSGFLIKEKHVPPQDWQTAYNEQYLNKDGTRVIGNYVNHSSLGTVPVRVAFFLYLEDLSAPLSTPYGDVALPTPEALPRRLRDLLDFSPMD